MILKDFNYINLPDFVDRVEVDIKNLLEINNKYATFIHVVNVARLNGEIAEKFKIDKDKCILSGYFHDISAVITPNDMLEYAKENNFFICDAEQRFPFLLHQRISKVIANEYFHIDDEDILSAIECHTTLKANPTKYEMALFIADKLAWDQDGIPPFYDNVNAAINHSLEEACYVYMSYMNDNGRVLFPHTNWKLAYEWLRLELNI